MKEDTEEKKKTIKKSTPRKKADTESKETTPKKKTTSTAKKTTAKKTTTAKKEPAKKEEAESTALVVAGTTEVAPVAKKTTKKKTTKRKSTAKKAAEKKVEKEEKEIKKIIEEAKAKEEIEVEEVPEIEESPKEEKIVEVKEEPKPEPVEEPKEEPKEEIKEEPKEEKVQEVKEEPKKEEKTDVVAPVVVPTEVKEEPKKVEESPVYEQVIANSYFDGKLIQLIGWILIGLLVSVLTLGLGIPFAVCFVLDWKYKHTVINGKRLCFDGNGLQLWGNYIKWLFFTIITLGIFSLFLPVQWNRWIVKHTHYEGNKKPRINYSLFDGITWEYIGISLLSFVLNLFTLGLLTPFCETLMYSWRINHTTYDTIDMEFDGKGWQLYGNYIKWTFLTIITLGIYGLWVPIRRQQWETKHTNEKGFSKRPYRPMLGMFLPVVFAIGCLSAEIYGLTQVKKETWTKIGDTIEEYVNSIKEEVEQYDWYNVVAERVSDVYYMITNKDCEISWDERYERYFKPTKLDKIASNSYNDYFDGTVDMTILDVNGVEDPVLLVKDEDTYRLFWLLGDKVENHYFKATDEVAGLYLVQEGNKEYLGIVEHDKDSYKLFALKDTANYRDKYIVYGKDLDDFVDELKDNSIKLKDVNIHYNKVNIDNMNGYESAVKYYYSHTEKEYDTEEEKEEEKEQENNTDYVSAYLDYLKENLNGVAKVSILDISTANKPVLVVLENNRTLVLSFDGRLDVKEFGKASLGAIKKSTKSEEDWTLIASNDKSRKYYIIEDVINGNEDNYIDVKNSNYVKELKELGYKESLTKAESFTIYKNDLSNLESKLKNDKSVSYEYIETININQLESAVKVKEKVAVLVSSDTSSAALSFEPVLDSALKEKEITVYRLSITNMDKDEVATLKRYCPFNKIPYLCVIENGVMLKNSNVEGSISKEEVLKWLNLYVS